MKQLEIKTNKRLLIVEGGFMYYYNGSPLKYICKGSDLTEVIAKGLVPNDLGFLFDGDSKEYCVYPDYKNIDHPFEDKSFDTALESLISSIEASGYHWGENPYEKELDSCNAYTDMFTIAKTARKYEEAESRTFNPSKCIIFEIL